VQRGSNIQTQVWNAFASVFKTSLAIIKLTIIGDCGGASFQPARTREKDEHFITHLHIHLSEIFENLGVVREEQGECFHQDIKVMKNITKVEHEGRLLMEFDERFPKCN